MKATPFLLEAQWNPDWQPDPRTLAWFKQFFAITNEGALWTVPATGQIYQISHANKTLTLIFGDPNDPQHWHDMLKITVAKLGYKVLDGPEPPPNPDEKSFAESIVSALIEDVPFDKQEATLQYRPYQAQDGWKWFWVLLPKDKSRALASGTAESRALASTQARLKARSIGVVIQGIDMIKPHTPQS